MIRRHDQRHSTYTLWPVVRNTKQSRPSNNKGASDDPGIYLYVGACFRKSGRNVNAHFGCKSMILRDAHNGRYRK